MAEEALRDAEEFIETKGMEALRLAKEAQERFGQQSQRMTDIAKEAREEAERWAGPCVNLHLNYPRIFIFRRRKFALICSAYNEVGWTYDTQFQI